MYSFRHREHRSGGTVVYANSGVDAERERSKREVEAEAVGYVVGRYFGLNTSGSAFYLVAWQDDGTETLQGRLGRVSSTAETINAAVVEYVTGRIDTIAW